MIHLFLLAKLRMREFRRRTARCSLVVFKEERSPVASENDGQCVWGSHEHRPGRDVSLGRVA